MEDEKAKEKEEKAVKTTTETTTIESEHAENRPISENIKQEAHISDTTDNSLDGSFDTHPINSDEVPQHAIPVHQPVQLEADVEIHNVGTSGHLSPLSDQHNES